MTFEEWCYSKQIHGNFKEALFHSLAAKYGVGKIESIGQDIWDSEWKEVLAQLLKSLR